MSLIHWWPLCGKAYDQGLHYSPILEDTTSYIISPHGQAAHFTTDTSHIKIDNLAELTKLSKYSMSCWVYLEQQSTNHSASFLSSGDWNSWNRQLCFAAYDFANNTYRQLLVPNKEGWTVGVTLKHPISLNKWYNIIIIYNGQKTQVYINNIFEGEVNSGGINPTNVDYYYLGAATYYNGFTMHGKLNDFRIYDHCLSKKEILEIAKGKVLDYDFNNPYIVGTKNLLEDNHFADWSSYGFGGLGQGSAANIPPALSGETFKITSSSTSSGNNNVEWARWVTTNMTQNKKVTFSIYVKGTQSSIGHSAFAHIYNSDGTNTISRSGTYVQLSDQWQRIEYTMTWPYNTTSASSSVYVVAQIPGGASYYISNPQVEFTENATPYTTHFRDSFCPDSSGFNNNALALHNPIISQDTETHKNYLDCRGNNWITMPKSMKIETAFTMNIWAYMDNWSQYSRMISCTEGGGWNIEAYPNFTFACYDKGYGYVNANTSISPGSLKKGWHMFTLKFDGNNVYGYIDGNQVAKSANYKSHLVGYNAFNSIFIGAESEGNDTTTNAEKFNGRIDSVKIYMTALSNSEIYNMYHTRIQIDRNYNFYNNTIIDEIPNFAAKTTVEMSSPHYYPAGWADIYGSYENRQPRCGNGVYCYEQEYNHTTFTASGARIYSPPNIVYSEVGDKMWGGFSFQPMDIDKDFIKEGHRYLITWHMEGQTSRGTNYYWTNYFGWGGGGLDPDTSKMNIKTNAPTGSFKGKKDCYYIFTADAPWKTCNRTYAGYTAGNVYSSYNFFTIGYGYADTGPLGTDMYISNFRMYDITDLENKNINFTKKGFIKNAFLQEANKVNWPSDLSTMITKRLEDNSLWARIFYHNNKGGTQLFSKISESLDCDTPYKYGKLGLLNFPIIKNADNEYEFLLEYPADDKYRYNRWKQTSHPYNDSIIAGYKPIHIDWDQHNWGGFTHNGGSCLMDGSIGGYWYYAIGATSSWSTGIPSYESTAAVTELWIRIDNTKFYKDLVKKKIDLNKKNILSADNFVED